VDISNDRSTNEDVLNGALMRKTIGVSDEDGGAYVAPYSYQMRILQFLDNLNVIQLDVQVLVHAFQDALELNVIFELHGDLVVDERLEEAIYTRIQISIDPKVYEDSSHLML
jgi:hypothetical protein